MTQRLEGRLAQQESTIHRLNKTIEELNETIDDLQSENCKLRKESGHPCPEEAEGTEQLTNGTSKSHHNSLQVEAHMGTLGAWIWLILFAIICICGQFVSCVWCTFLSSRSLSIDLADWLQSRHLYAPLTPLSSRNKDEMEVIGQIMKREMRVKIVTPMLFSLLTCRATSCHHGIPWWGYFVMIAIVARAKYFEWWILQRITKNGKQAMFTLSFSLGVIDHLGWLTDVGFPMQAFWCEPDATNSFTGSLLESKVPDSILLVSKIRFWGLCLVSLSAAMLAQQTFGSMGKGVSGLAACADVACFGAVANHYSGLEPEAEKGFMKVVTTFSLVLLKNVCQLWLQVSFFGMTYGSLGPLPKAKLLFGLSLNLIGALMKTRLAAPLNPKQIFQACNYGRPDLACIVVGIFIVQLFSFLMVLWSVVKLYETSACPTHLWNIGAGCVKDHGHSLRF